MQSLFISFCIMTQAGDYVMPMGEATDFSRALVIEVSGFS